MDDRRRARSAREALRGPVLAVVAVGGALGALARHAADVLAPHPAGGFPATTLAVNVLGCLLIGVLGSVLAERGRPLLRPFLTTGVLGGFTTFSTYAVDAEQLLRAGRPGIAVGYLAGTLVAALVATRLGIGLARRLGAPR